MMTEGFSVITDTILSKAILLASTRRDHLVTLRKDIRLQGILNMVDIPHKVDTPHRGILHKGIPQQVILANMAIMQVVSL